MEFIKTDFKNKQEKIKKYKINTKYYFFQKDIICYVVLKKI